MMETKLLFMINALIKSHGNFEFLRLKALSNK